jgi:hypothetical protein
MKISTTALGIVAMAASPFLLIELSLGRQGNTSMTGLGDLIYMAGWTCVVIALLRLHATGSGNKHKMILYVQLGTLMVAQAWNIWTIADPGNTSLLFRIMDFFWPTSNIILLVAGIIIAVKGVLQGWKRYAVLIAGSWLPFSIIVFMSVGNGMGGIIISGGYSTIAWFGMGYMTWKSRLEIDAQYHENNLQSI